MARLLVVDDEKSICSTIETVVRSMGHDVEVADSGEMALNMMRRQAPDILLTDLRMDGMSGLDLLGKTREYFPSVTVAMMTALLARTARRLQSAAGARLPLGAKACASSTASPVAATISAGKIGRRSMLVTAAPPPHPGEARAGRPGASLASGPLSSGPSAAASPRTARCCG